MHSQGTHQSVSNLARALVQEILVAIRKFALPLSVLVMKTLTIPSSGSVQELEMFRTMDSVRKKIRSESDLDSAARKILRNLEAGQRKDASGKSRDAKG